MTLGETRQRIEDVYGYDKYPGNCHAIPNHGLMIMVLVYAGDDFHKAIHIINTCGWDTDCNSGNLGCLVAIMHGMAAFDGRPDWHGPLADRALISSADAGYSINNAARIANDLANLGSKLTGEAPLISSISLSQDVYKDFKRVIKVSLPILSRLSKQ